MSKITDKDLTDLESYQFLNLFLKELKPTIITSIIGSRNRKM